MTKIQNKWKRKIRNFVHLDLGLVSDFNIRISNFEGLNRDENTPKSISLSDGLQATGHGVYACLVDEASWTVSERVPGYP
jgi:hypothetical protein